MLITIITFEFMNFKEFASVGQKIFIVLVLLLLSGLRDLWSQGLAVVCVFLERSQGIERSQDISGLMPLSGRVTISGLKSLSGRKISTVSCFINWLIVCDLAGNRQFYKMSSPSKRRDMDVMKLMMSDYSVEPINDGINEFNVEFRGPKESPYEGGVWKVRVELPDAYPYKSPSIGFLNKIFHPKCR